MPRDLPERYRRYQVERHIRDAKHPGNELFADTWSKTVAAGKTEKILRAKAIGRDGITIFVRQMAIFDVEGAGHSAAVYRNTAKIRCKVGSLSYETTVVVPLRGYSGHFVCDEIEVEASVHVDSEHSFLFAGGCREGNVRPPVQQLSWEENDFDDPPATYYEPELAPFTKEFRLILYDGFGENENPDAVLYLTGPNLLAGSDFVAYGVASDFRDWTPLPREATNVVVFTMEDDTKAVVEVR